MQKTKLAADLSNAGPSEGQASGSAAAVGNYYYDDGAQDSEGGADGDNRRGLEHPSVEAASMNRPTSLSRRINQPSSAINQLRKVLQSVHLNQRVVSVTVEMQSLNPMKHVPVSIDGVKLQ